MKEIIKIIAGILFIILIISSIIIIGEYNNKKMEDIFLKEYVCMNDYCNDSLYSYFNTSTNVCECWDINEYGRLNISDSIEIMMQEEFNKKLK